MEAIERRSESPLSKNRSSSRLSNVSSQEFSDDSDTALIEHVKAKKRGRPKKQKEKENGNFHPDENGTNELIQTNGTFSDHEIGKEELVEEERFETNSTPEIKDVGEIVVMEMSRENSEFGAGEVGDMIDVQIEEAEDSVDVEESTCDDKIVITINESIVSQDGEVVEVSVSEIPDARIEEDGIVPDKDDGKPGMSEQEVQKDFDDHKIANDTDNADDRWSVTVNVDSTDQKDLLENQSENADKDADTSNSSFTNKISNLLGNWSPVKKSDSENIPVYYPRISARPGLKSATPERNLAGPSTDFKTPALTRFLDDSFRVKSEPAKLLNKGEDKSQLKKYRGKRCLADDDETEENGEGFFSRLSFRKRRKLNDSTASGSGFFGSVFRSPFKKRSAVSDVKTESPNQESRFSWLLTSIGFGKKKLDDADDANDDVSSAEIAVDETATSSSSSVSPPTSDDVIKTDDKPLETKETGGCYIM